ncbi:MAG: hypothetical protein ACREVF_01715 [Burkholderiales bacterium]
MILIRLLLHTVVLAATGSFAEEPAPVADSAETGIEVSTDTAIVLDEDAEEPDPCVMEKDEELLGLDWSRRQLHRGICASVRWFDGFFGEQRYDEAAKKVRGRVVYTVEQRQGVGIDGRLRFRLQVSTPNLNKRMNFFVESGDERNSVLSRTDGVTEGDTTQPTSATQEDTLRIGFGYDSIKKENESLTFRLGLRIQDGEPAPAARARYQREFLRTDISQWRFTETFFWRKVEGWGETTALDYEYKINEPTLARWFNDGTWSQSTLGLSWRTGITLFRNLGNAKAALAEVRIEGQTDAAVNVSTYGERLAYRQTLGRKWLLGEVYTGYDWPKSSPGEVRHSQLYVGVTLEILFGHH